MTNEPERVELLSSSSDSVLPITRARNVVAENPALDYVEIAKIAEVSVTTARVALKSFENNRFNENATNANEIQDNVDHSKETLSRSEIKRIICLNIDSGKFNISKTAKDLGINKATVDRYADRYFGYKEGMAEGLAKGLASRELDLSTLSQSAQDKIDLAVRRKTQQLETLADQRVSEMFQCALEGVWNELERREREVEDVMKARNGIMPRKSYLAILAALHPDSRAGFTEERLASLFATFKSFETVICKEAEFPTSRTPLLPKGAGKWAEMKRRATAAKSAGKPQGMAKQD